MSHQKKALELLDGTPAVKAEIPAEAAPTTEAAPMPPAMPEEPEAPEVEEPVDGKKPIYKAGDKLKSPMGEDVILTGNAMADFVWMCKKPDGNIALYAETQLQMSQDESAPVEEPAQPEAPSAAVDLAPICRALGIAEGSTAGVVCASIVALLADRDGMAGDRDTELKAAGMPEAMVELVDTNKVQRSSGQTWAQCVEKVKMKLPAMFGGAVQASKSIATTDGDTTITKQAKIPEGLKNLGPVDISKPQGAVETFEARQARIKASTEARTWRG
jgi:hypothetical protein